MRNSAGCAVVHSPAWRGPHEAESGRVEQPQTVPFDGMSTHEARAIELAAQADEVLQELLKSTQARADGKRISAFAGYGSEGARSEVLQMRLQVIQAQAQIYATLAVVDGINRGGDQ